MRAFAFAAVALAACDEPAPTYHAEIRPLLERRCVSCHTEGGVAPFALDDLAAVGAWREPIVAAVEARVMPPWGMDPDCREIVGSEALSEAEIATFTAWAEAGFPVGAAEDYVAPERPAPVDLGEPDRLLDFGAPYTPSTERADDYRCVPIGDPLESDLFLRGLDVRPDRAELVHHVLLYAVPGKDVAAMQALDAADPEIGYRCFGDTGVGDSQTVGGWAPGGVPSLLPEGLATRVPRGAQLLVQVHYNTAAAEPTADRTQVALWTLPEGERPEWLVTTFPVAHTTFEVSPGATQEVGKGQRIPASARIIGSSPHMHTRGQRIETTLVRPDGTRECLSRVEAWDFDWQRGYDYAEAAWVDLSVDDVIELSCTYDNAGNAEPLTWGDGTADEMCLDYLSLLVPNTIGEEQGTCAGFDGCFEACPADDPWCAFSCMSAAGETCLYCGIDLLYGGCLRETCDSETTGFGLCVLSCMDGPEDFFSCAYETCATGLTAWWGCAGEALGGECAGAMAACDGPLTR